MASTTDAAVHATRSVAAWETGMDGKTLQNVDLAEGKTAQQQDVEKDLAASAANKNDTGEAFSVFTTKQKRLIVLAGSTAGIFSPMTGSIYYPAITTIARDLHVTNTQVNLTVTTYLIVQGLAPMMIAGFSDNMGRRPAYVLCFVIYIVANLALGLQNNYVALLILRMV